jgi:hypothetical protein
MSKEAFSVYDSCSRSVLYYGLSLNQAIRISRKHDCGPCSKGPTIYRETNGAILRGWQATAPFKKANVRYWEN